MTKEEIYDQKLQAIRNMKEEFCSKCGRRMFGTECGHCLAEEIQERQDRDFDARYP
jgi:hypothetical protein